MQKKSSSGATEKLARSLHSPIRSSTSLATPKSGRATEFTAFTRLESFSHLRPIRLASSSAMKLWVALVSTNACVGFPLSWCSQTSTPFGEVLAHSPHFPLVHGGALAFPCVVALSLSWHWGHAFMDNPLSDDHRCEENTHSSSAPLYLFILSSWSLSRRLSFLPHFCPCFGPSLAWTWKSHLLNCWTSQGALQPQVQKPSPWPLARHSYSAHFSSLFILRHVGDVQQ